MSNLKKQKISAGDFFCNLFSGVVGAETGSSPPPPPDSHANSIIEKRITIAM